MSFANFFDKTAMAASQILRGFEDDAFRRRLESCIVCVSFDDSATDSHEGRVSLELTTNLLSRLYPKLQLRALGKNAKNQIDALCVIARSINPAIEFSPDTVQPLFCISIGNSTPPVACPRIFIGSDGWIVKASSERPMGSKDSGNPFGAGAAACFGAANAFRYVFSQQLANADLDSHFEVSLIDWEFSPPAPPNPVLNEMDIQEIHLVGVGAIGNGAIWVLSRVSGLRGVLHLIDNERVELSNLQRYVLAYQNDLNVEKV